MNNFLKDNWFKIIIALCAIIIALSIFNYFVAIPISKSLGECEQGVLIFWKKPVEGCNPFNFR